jgi:hypothetical protein
LLGKSEIGDRQYLVKGHTLQEIEYKMDIDELLGAKQHLSSLIIHLPVSSSIIKQQTSNIKHHS